MVFPRIKSEFVHHFDIHFKNRKNPQPHEYLEKLGLQSHLPYMFLGMSSPRFAPHEIDIVEWLAEEVEKGTFGKEMQLVVRPHPQNVQSNMADQSWLPRLKAIHKGRVAVDFPDLVKKSKIPWSMHQKDMDRLSHLIAGSTVSLNSGSTLSIDSLCCGVPVILTSFDGNADLKYWKSARRLVDYPHLKKLVSYGGVRVVGNYEEMKKSILAYCMDENCDLEKRKHTLYRHCGEQSEATEEVVDWLMQGSWQKSN